MDTISLILHVTAAAALVGPQLLLFGAVIPATRQLPEAERGAVTRVVTRRFGMLAGVALLTLLVTGLYQFYEVVPQAVQDEMNEFRFGMIFITKMTLLVVLVALIVAHAMWLGPRIQRAVDEVRDASSDAGDESEALRTLRRRSLWISGAMVGASLAVLALGVTLGHHEYSYVSR
ncbi:MAG: CopD family protein [Chloroflexi bacterium]|nr:CopD family protein [Chloroflexota bacterium]